MLIMWDITNRCNQACKHCYNAQSNNTSVVDAVLSPNDIANLNSFIRTHRVRNLVIVGGEPFLRHDLFDIINSLRKDLNIAVTTNGSLMSKEIIKSINNSQIAKIGVSLESARKKKYETNRGLGNYNKLLSSLKLLKNITNKYNDRIYKELSVAVLNGFINCDKDIQAIYELALKYDVDAITFQYPITAGGHFDYLSESDFIFHSAQSIARVSLEYSTITTFLQYKKILVDYCNEKYGSKLKGGKTFCPAINQMVVMNNRMHIFPCVYHNNISEVRLIHNFFRCSVSDIEQSLSNKNNPFKSIFMKEFDKHKHQIQKKCHSGICSKCPYHGRCFKICPYDWIINKEKAMEEHTSVCRLIFRERPSMLS